MDLLMQRLSFSEKLDEATLLPATRCQSLRALHEFSKVSFDRAIEIERAVARTHFQTQTSYILSMKRIVFNLASNPALHDRHGEALVYASDAELARGTLTERVQLQERQTYDNLVSMLKEKTEAAENMNQESVLTCKKCKSTKIHFIQLQLRSADEPMCTFMTCQECSLRWKM